MNKFYTTVCCFFISFFALAQNSPKRELRAAWIATFSNIDWPASGATTSAEQSTFIQRITEHKTTGMNAVFVQVRSQCDAMYFSNIEPWSRDLTGTQGVPPNPYYDPMEFMITECRKLGLEFHAWFNPYRALSSATPANLAALSGSHVINTNSSWILDCTTTSTGVVQKILNPGIPAVTDYIISVVMDVVRRYDVDGIHMDDYFYPNPAITTFDDDATFAANSRGIVNKNDWRRANIDSLVKRLGDSIRAVKPWIKYGYSPSGIWVSSSTSSSQVNGMNAFGSNTSSGATQHYKDHFANSRLWQQNNWIDYLIPQVYWHQGQTGSDYSNLTPWWSNNAFNRHMYIGMASYKVGASSQGLFTTDNRQIPNQVRMNRANVNITGSVYYNTTTLRSNALGHRDSLQQFFYNRPALEPLMAWKSNLTAPVPTNFVVSPVNATTVNLSWTKPTDGLSEYQKTRQFIVYRSTVSPIDITNSSNILTITNTDAITTFQDNTLDGTSEYFYAVASLNRLHAESNLSNTVNSNGLPLTLQNFYVKNINNNVATLNWITTNELNVSHFELQNSTDEFMYRLIEKIAAKNKSINNYTINTNFNNIVTQYYRLKMVDIDGKFNYSNVLKINPTSKGVEILNTQIVKGGNIQYNLLCEDKNASFVIVDASAKVLQLGKLQTNATKGYITLSNNYTTGIYYVKIIHQHKVYTTSIFVQ